MKPEFLVGALALGSVMIVQTYEQAAPSLAELRQMEQHDILGRQELLDADIIIGSITLFVSAISSYAMKSSLPAIMFIGTFAISAGWRRMVLNAPNPKGIDNGTR